MNLMHVFGVVRSVAGDDEEHEDGHERKRGIVTGVAMPAQRRVGEGK